MPDVNIFEEEAWPITIRAKRKGPIKTKDVKLKIRYPDDTKVEQFKLSDSGTTVCRHTTTKVPADQANYSITASVEYKNRLIANDRADIEDTCTVWPRSAVVTVKDEADNPVEGFKFRLKQGAHTYVQTRTNAEGKAEVPLGKRTGALSVESTGPHEILEQNAPKLRELTVKVRRTYLAKFVGISEFKGTFPPTAAPVIDTKNGNRIKAWVNMEKGKADKGSEVWGNEVEFEVAAYDNDGYTGKKNDTIHVRVAFGRESKRNDPEPELTAPPDPVTKEHVNPPGTKLAEQKKNNVQWGTVKVDSDGGTAKFTVQLGHAGGDTCQIRIGASKKAAEDPSAKTLELINWRRLFYELQFPDFMAVDLDGDAKNAPDKIDLPPTMRNKMNHYLAPSFIEYKLFKSHSFDGSAKNLKGVTTSKFINITGGRDKRYVYGGKWEEEGGDLFEATDTTVMKMRLWDGALSAANPPDTTFSYVTVTSGKGSFDLGNYVYTYEARTGKQHDIDITDGACFWYVKIPQDKRDNYLKYPELKWTTPAAPDTTGAVARQVSISEQKFNAGPITITFNADPMNAASRELTGPQKNQITNFMNGLLSKKGDLRTNGNYVEIKITGENAPGAATNRFNNVKAAVISAFEDKKQKVPMHPGLDDDGTRKEGDVTDLTVTRSTWTKVDVQLTDKLSAIAGPDLTDTKAPIGIKIKHYDNYGINGNAGSGRQNMVLDMAQLEARAQTGCHELGHSMGMTVSENMTDVLFETSAPPGLADICTHVDDGGDYYCNPADSKATEDEGRRKIHMGPHCAEGVNKKDQAAANWDNDGTCIMYGAGTKTRIAFCKTCETILKGRNLKDIISEYDSNRADEDL